MRPSSILLAGLIVPLAAAPGGAAPLEATLGRNETRVLSAPFTIPAGKSVQDLALDTRLERLGYRRVKVKPSRPGEYFHGNDTYWFYRRACRANGKDQAAALVSLRLDPGTARIMKPGREEDAWLEPEVLAESLDGDRAVRVRLDLSTLPERLWRAVLAAEDARFFEHGGLDPRALARAALKNLRKGRIVEGGSTITQQLVKNRDLSPKRTFGRKASEAMRAFSLESEYDKKEILQAYLNTVYLGHVEGLGVYGLGTAALAYFSKPAAELDLAEAATLAAMIQAPNRLSPIHDAKALRERRDWVLTRMEELGWEKPADVARARRQDLGSKVKRPTRLAPVHVLSEISREMRILDPGWAEEGRGLLIETTLDPWLQHLAEQSVRDHLDALSRAHRSLRGTKLSAAVVALDARTGAVLAWVGGDPDDPPGAFDRVRLAKRQPGSLVKPFVALEALDTCGGRGPLTASSLILDEPIRIDLPSGPWEPENFDREYHGPVLFREAVAESRNVPSVRIARWCGFDKVALTFEEVGLDLPASPPPSFVLGAVETSPLNIARAYTVLATPGRVLEPFTLLHVETPGGGALDRGGPASRKVASPSAAYLVRDLLRTAVEEGTATSGAIAGVEVAAKTGTSSELRDAWFAGQAGSIVAVVWVGLDSGGKLGLTGAQAAGPLWHDFMAAGAAARPDHGVERPRDIVEQWVQERTGLLVGKGRLGARPELYRKGTLPPRKRWWRFDQPMPVIE